MILLDRLSWQIVSISDEKIQISLLILRWGALSTGFVKKIKILAQRWTLCYTSLDPLLALERWNKVFEIATINCSEPWYHPILHHAPGSLEAKSTKITCVVPKVSSQKNILAKILGFQTFSQFKVRSLCQVGPSERERQILVKNSDNKDVAVKLVFVWQIRECLGD